MKNLYRKERIHPSPSSGGGGSVEVMAVLRLLPAAILALTTVLGAEDREVLAYLMTRSMSGAAAEAPLAGQEPRKCRRASGSGGIAGGAAFDCGCFDCYTSFWSRWDCSSQRELIHQAIEGFEEHLATRESGGRVRRRDRSRLDKGKKKKKKGKEVRKLDVELEVEQPETEGGGGGFFFEEKAADVEVAEVKAVEDEGDDSVDATAEEETFRDERRRGWPDVIGLFSSRLWSLWGPAV